MASLPETIRIGGTDYVVSEHKDLRDGDTWLNGHIVYDQCQIRIDSELAEHRKFITIWHEVLHGLLEHAGMGDHDEKLIVALGYGVAQALRDNEYLRNG